VDPSVESHIVQLKNSGANVFFIIAIPKFAAQALRKSAEIGWRPAQYLASISSSVQATMAPAGLDNVQGVITSAWLKDPSDRRWDNDDEIVTWRAWMRQYMPGANASDTLYLYAYAASFLMEQTLRLAGNDLTRENVMRQAAGHRGLRVPGLLPGIMINTSPTDFYPVQSMYLQRFRGQSWELFGGVMSAESP
jgi:branched-chain amino acid transport system substrate-binding protein